MTYETLLMEAEDNGIEVLEDSRIGKLNGLYIDDMIIINSNIQTDVERLCVLAEELGHFYTSSGNILDQSKIQNRKQEYKARGWGYEKIIPIHRLIDGYLHGATNLFNLSEYLGVTEKYLIDAINYYHGKYGIFVDYRDYRVYFNPLVVVYRGCNKLMKE